MTELDIAMTEGGFWNKVRISGTMEDAKEAVLKGQILQNCAAIRFADWSIWDNVLKAWREGKQAQASAPSPYNLKLLLLEGLSP